MVWRSPSVVVQSIDIRKRHLRGAPNSIEFSLELTRKTEVNQSMKYIHSHKFKALGIAVATAVAVVATATPSLATYHPVPSETTGPTPSETTGPTPSETTGPTPSENSHPSLPGMGGIKKEMHYSLNSQQTAAIRALIVQLRSDFKTAKTSGNLDTFYRVTLPAAKLAYFAIVKPSETTGAAHATSLTGLKDESKGRSNSLFGEKDESKGKHIDRSPW
jgi:hypothetical protein